MKSFKKLDIKPVYDSSDDIQGFYNTTLSSAVLYQRVSAYFDHRLFSYISKGVKQLLLNNGSMELILSTENKNPMMVKEMKEGYKARETYKTDSDIKKMLKENEDFASLKFLIMIGKLDIKIAEMDNGIQHEKYALMRDEDNNILLFSGSNNETKAALESNYESFETTFSWEASKHEKAKIEHRVKAFRALWADENPKTNVWDAEHYFNYIYQEELPTKEDAEIPKEIKENIILVDYFKEDNTFVLKSNHANLNEYFTSFRGQIFSKLTTKKTKDNFRFKSTLNDSDIIKIYDYIVDINKEFNNKLVLSRRFESFYDLKKLDLNALASVGMEVKDKTFKESEAFINFKNNVNALIARDLREAQLVSAYHAVYLRRTMNFSVPGSGKTATILGAYFYLKRFMKLNKLIVVGPINCFKAWREEYQILDPTIDVYELYDSTQESGYDKVEILEKDYNKFKVIMINYESMPNIINSLEKLVDSNSMVVFDEIHRIKRIDGVYYNACDKLAKKTKYRTALTGTPIPNGYVDLHNLFKILFDDYAVSYFSFTDDMLSAIQKTFEKTEIEDKDVNDKIFPFYTRVSKADLEVPKPEPDNIIKVIPNEREKRLYQQIFDDKNRTLFSKITALMQVGVLGNLAKQAQEEDIEELIGEEKVEGKSEDISTDLNTMPFITSKVEKTIEIVENLVSQGKSVVVWAVFIKTIRLLHRLICDKGIDAKMIYGNTSFEDRGKTIDDFNQKKISVIISNPSTLAESVSLHKVCHDAIYIEFNFNLAQYLQSRDRIHRLGLKPTDKTNYYILFNDYGYPSIEDKIYQTLKRKEKLMYSAIERGDLFTYKNIELDDIEDFLNRE